MIVPTPIGNMEDISPNMLRALLSADLIGCEDRRVAGQLYSLIRNRNVLGELNTRFGDIGLTALMPAG
jgi:16S rRNA C1402 (ribose-2'-O) methylase RsmI